MGSVDVYVLTVPVVRLDTGQLVLQHLLSCLGTEFISSIASIHIAHCDAKSVCPMTGRSDVGGLRELVWTRAALALPREPFDSGAFRTKATCTGVAAFRYDCRRLETFHACRLGVS